ncbi:MAG: PTS sugar transporter subunit IIA [Merdibacter sp.]
MKLFYIVAPCLVGRRIDDGETQRMIFGTPVSISRRITFSLPTFIAVVVLDEKIRWEEDQVNVVFLVSIEKDNLLAYKIWHYLSYLISNEAAIQALNQTPTYEHLIETVKKIYADIFR